ncbi:MAG: hypothetical protein U1F49_07770 [Rubrivivax sp.]
MTYALGHVAAGHGPQCSNGRANWNPGSTFSARPRSASSSASVVVPAKGVATVDVTITANAACRTAPCTAATSPSRRKVFGTLLQVPYSGLKGDYQTTVHVGAGPDRQPDALAGDAGRQLVHQVHIGLRLQPDQCQYGAVLLLSSGALAAHREGAGSGDADDARVVSVDDRVGRNGTPGGFYAFPWDGTTTLGTQPNGNWAILRLSVLKAPGMQATWRIGRPGTRLRWSWRGLILSRPPSFAGAVRACW